MSGPALDKRIRRVFCVIITPNRIISVVLFRLQLRSSKKRRIHRHAAVSHALLRLCISGQKLATGEKQLRSLSRSRFHKDSMPRATRTSRTEPPKNEDGGFPVPGFLNQRRPLRFAGGRGRNLKKISRP